MDTFVHIWVVLVGYSRAYASKQDGNELDEKGIDGERNLSSLYAQGFLLFLDNLE